MANTYQQVLADVAASGATTYTTVGDFPATASDGSLAIDQSTDALYYFKASLGSWVLLSAGSGSSTTTLEPTITLTGADITNGFVVLSNAPTNKANTRVVVIGGIMQEYTADFIVTSDDGGKRLMWLGLGLDGILETGDKLVITHD